MSYFMQWGGVFIAPAIVVVALAGAIVAAPYLVGRCPPVLAPRSFYDSFPLGASRVDMPPPFNQHLISGVGGLYLAFALLFVWAAVTLRRPLIVPLCTAWGIAVRNSTSSSTSTTVVRIAR